MLSTSSTVDEGDPATGVCLTVSAGSPAATALGCDLDIMLTTMPGNAGTNECYYCSYRYTQTSAHYWMLALACIDLYVFEVAISASLLLSSALMLYMNIHISHVCMNNMFLH